MHTHFIASYNPYSKNSHHVPATKDTMKELEAKSQFVLIIRFFSLYSLSFFLIYFIAFHIFYCF